MLILGGGGFIGNHLEKRLKVEEILIIVLYDEKIDWEVSQPLIKGLKKTYN